MQNPKILRLPAVMAMTGVSRQSIYRWGKAGTFPAPMKIGPRNSGWLLAEVENWIVDRSAARFTR